MKNRPSENYDKL